MVRQYLHLFQANVVVAKIRVLAHNALNSTEICGKKCILLKFSLSLSRLWLSHLVLMGNGFEVLTFLAKVVLHQLRLSFLRALY